MVLLDPVDALPQSESINHFPGDIYQHSSEMTSYSQWAANGRWYGSIPLTSFSEHVATLTLWKIVPCIQGGISEWQYHKNVHPTVIVQLAS